MDREAAVPPIVGPVKVYEYMSFAITWSSMRLSTFLGERERESDRQTDIDTETEGVVGREREREREREVPVMPSCFPLC